MQDLLAAVAGGLTRRKYKRSIAIFAFALALGTLLFIFAGTSWLLIGTDVALLTFAIRQRSSWLFAFAGAVISTLAAAAVLAQVAPWSHLAFANSMLISLVIAGCGLLVWLAVNGAPRLPSARSMVIAVTAAIVPLACLVLVAVKGTREKLGYSWAMNNDAVWNVVTARFVADEGGVQSSLHANPSPLTPVLVALADSAGRSSTSPSALLLHDVSHAAQLWLVLIALTSVFAGMIGLRATRAGHVVIRMLAGAALSTLPLTWFIVGYSLEFGFINATLSLVVLLAIWVMWTDLPPSPALALILFVLAGIAMLATWGPLALIPAAFIVLSMIRSAKRWRTTSSRGRVWSLVGAAGLVIYLLAVTVPDILRDGGSLSANGGIFTVTASQAAIAASVTAVVTLGYGVYRRKTGLVVGFIALLVAGSLGLGLLLFERRTDAYVWGYYPIKFTWIMMSVLFVILAASLFAVASQFRRRVWMSALILVSSGGLVGFLLLQNPPRYAPLSRNLFPIANVLNGTSVAALNPGATSLFSIVRAGTATMAVRLTDAQYDRFSNFWSLQLQSTSPSDPIRKWAYFLNPEDDLQVCSAMRAWNQPVTVFTSEKTLRTRLLRECAHAKFRVILKPHNSAYPTAPEPQTPTEHSSP